jgi:hypothetical protein
MKKMQKEWHTAPKRKKIFLKCNYGQPFRKAGNSGFDTYQWSGIVSPLPHTRVRRV